MFQLPPVPSWDGLHPLIIHFPIGLLLIAPLFVLLGVILSPKVGRWFFVAALVLMLLGTISAFVAVETGEAAGKLADRNPEINATLERHQELAETTRNAFATLTVVFALILLLPTVLKWEPGTPTQAAVAVLFLIFYGAGTLMLVNTAHQGGMLVHKHGVHALLAPDSNAPAPVETPHEGD